MHFAVSYELKPTCYLTGKIHGKSVKYQIAKKTRSFQVNKMQLDGNSMILESLNDGIQTSLQIWCGITKKITCWSIPLLYKNISHTSHTFHPVRKTIVLKQYASYEICSLEIDLNRSH